MAGWGVESPTWWGFYQFIGEQNSMEGWTQQELPDRSVEPLWFAFLMGTFSMSLVNLNLQTQICKHSFIFYKLSKYWLWAPIPSGRQKVWPQSSFPLASCPGSSFWDPSLIWWFWVPQRPSLLGHIQVIRRYGTVGRAWSPRPQNPACLGFLWLIPLRSCYISKVMSGDRAGSCCY